MKNAADLTLLVAADLHYSSSLTGEIQAIQDRLPADTYDHLRDGRLIWHNEMLVERMGTMLAALARLAREEKPNLLVCLGDMVNTNWSQNVAGFVRGLDTFACPIEMVTGNHDIYLGAPECRLQGLVFPGSFDSGLRYRLLDGLGLIFLDAFVKYGSGEFRKWLDPQADVVGTDYRPQDVEAALHILESHPDRPFIVLGHFPMCDPEERLRQDGRLVGRAAAGAAPLCAALKRPNNLLGIVTGHQHFNHLQIYEHGFHWTVPALVEYPCAAGILKIGDGRVRGRLVMPDAALASLSVQDTGETWTFGLGTEREYVLRLDALSPGDLDFVG